MINFVGDPGNPGGPGGPAGLRGPAGQAGIRKDELKGFYPLPKVIRYDTLAVHWGFIFVYEV